MLITPRYSSVPHSPMLFLSFTITCSSRPTSHMLKYCVASLLINLLNWIGLYNTYYQGYVDSKYSNNVKKGGILSQTIITPQHVQLTPLPVLFAWRLWYPWIHYKETVNAHEDFCMFFLQVSVPGRHPVMHQIHGPTRSNHGTHVQIS